MEIKTVSLSNMACQSEKRGRVLLVKPTHKCNLHCPYCYEYGKRDIETTMTLDDVKQIVSVFQNSEEPLNQWIWHGGEPLLMGEDFLYEASQIVRDAFPQIRLAIQTNGTLIREKTIELFKKTKMRPGLSFDGIHNVSTRNDTERLIHVFNLLEKHRIDFGAIMLITEKNVANLAAEYEFAKRLKIHQQMNLVFNVSDNPGAVEIESQRAIEGICNFFDYWVKDSNNPRNSKLLSDYVRLISGSGNQRSCCEQHCLGRWFGIHSNGDIYPCGRNWSEKYKYGNIYDFNSVEEIEESPVFLELKGKVDKIRKNCAEKCSYFQYCQAGCYATICDYDEEMNEIPTSHCTVTKGVIDYIAKKIKEFNPNEYYNPYYIKSLKGEE